DNSGSITYLRIEYTGVGSVDDKELHGLVLNSVGSGTVLENIQVSESVKDAFAFYGGKVNAKAMFALNPGGNAFHFNFGYRGMIQSLLSINQNVGTSTNGMLVSNNPANPTYLPLTQPTVSNFSLLGSSY